MLLIEAPIILATIILVALVAFGTVSLCKKYFHNKPRGKGDYAILRLKDGCDTNLNSLLETLKPPFTFEIAVHQIGSDMQCYIIVPVARVKGIEKTFEVERVENYDMYYAGGVQVGAYMKGGERWPDLDIDKIDFSKINDIGEGVVIQFLCNRKRGGGTVVNGRILVSAPSLYQANEIMTSLKPTFSGFKIIEVKNPDFLQRVYFRVFDDKETIVLRS